MNRQECEKYIFEEYGVEPDRPWSDDMDACVFRHANNKKWFGLIMNISKSRLGINEEGNVDVINVKAEPAAIGSFLNDPGFFPAYHMNKKYWVTILLDGSVPADKISFFLENSYNLTAVKSKRNNTIE